MIFFKSFFRKKSTIIYLIIYVILLVAIISVFSLIKYNKNIINEIYKKNSYVIMTSTNDYYDKILKEKDVTNVEKIILFKPNYNCDTLKKESYSIASNGMSIEYNNDETYDEQYSKIVTWEEVMVDGSIIIVSDKNKEFKLEKNEIAISHQGMQDKEQDVLDNLLGQSISFMYNNDEVKFDIKQYYNSNQVEMAISEEEFNKLTSKYSIYSYRVYIKDYINVSNIEEVLSYDENVKINATYNINGNEDSEKYYNATNLIDTIQIVSVIIILLFMIIFIIVSKNIMADEKKNMKIERMLGFTKVKSKKIMMFKLTLLNYVSFFISILISSILNYIINSIYNFQLIIIDVSIISFLFISVLALNLLLSILSLI